MNISLIGYRATGKTSVAEHLARQLGWSWADADVEIESVVGKLITEIFADEGEQRFRDIESWVVKHLAEGDRRVLALGGGAVLREENRGHIRRCGKVVWLKALAQTIHRRMAGDQTTSDRRPDLTPAGGMTEIIDLLQKRTPIYRESADLEIDTEGKSIEDVAEEILAALDLTPESPQG